MNFDAESILAKAKELGEDLERRVGATAFELPKLDLDDSGRQLEVFGQALTLDSTFQASATIHDPDDALVDPFGVAEPATPPDGDSFVTVDVGGELSLGGSGSTTSQGVTFSAHGTAGAGFGYQHRRTVSQGRKRRTVLEDVLLGVRLPQFVDLSTLDPGESHRLTAKVDFDLGIDAGAGKSFQTELQATLFDGLSAQATIQGEATVKAALGLSLYDQMALTVGRSMAQDSWVRIRLQRQKQRKLSLSASLDLTVRYDFGSALVQVLDNALDLVPTPALLDTFEEINGLLASGDWEAVKARLSARGNAVLDDWLESTGWREWLADSDEVQKFVDASREVVDAFQGLDGRIRSLWEQLLGKVALGPDSAIRKALETVAGLDPDDPDLIAKLAPGESAQEALALVEKLAGRSLDELILDSLPEAKEALGEAIALAQQGLDFLDDTPDKVLTKIQAFAERTGIAQTIGFLAANATSTAAIEQAIDDFAQQRIQRLVEVLVGKIWDAIQPDDLAKVETWAQRVQKILEAPDELEGRLKEALLQLDGQASFSASVAIDHEVQRSAMLDLELDVTTAPALATQIQNALRRGTATEIGAALEALDEKLAKNDDEESGDETAKTLPFRLRESVFTSRRVRSRTFSLTFLGFSRQASVSRTEEHRLQIRPVADEVDQYERLASFSASFSRRVLVDAGSNETAIWLEHEARGTGVDPAKPFEGTPAPALRLVYSREDFEASSLELDHMANLLDRLGFNEEGRIGRAVRDQWTTQLIIQLRFVDPDDAPGAALRALADTGDKASWNDAYLAAAKAWFENRLDDKTTTRGVNYGEIFGQLIRTPVFEQRWTQGTQSLLNQVRGESIMVKDGSRQEHIAWADLQGRPNTQLGILYGSMLPKRRRGRKALAKVIERLDGLGSTFDSDHAEALSVAFANAGLRSTVYGPNWPSSLFSLWLTLARLRRRDPQLLATAQGLAVLRTRVEKDDPWQEPVRFQLGSGGIPRLV